MDRGAPGKSRRAVGLVAVDLIGRIFGGGRRRRSRRNLGNSLCGLQGFNRLQDKSCHAKPGGVNLPPIENLEGRCDTTDEDEDEDELRLLQPRRPKSSFSSDDDSSKKWTSSTEQYSHRRRKGFYCMRLRIVNMVRIMAIMRKVRLAYRRMMSAAAASKTILSLADLYNDIADLIPVPCIGNNNDARTIVVIRPIKCAPGPSQEDEVEETPGVTSVHGCSASLSTTSGRSIACRPDAGNDGMSTIGPSKAVADHIPLSSWHRFAFPIFSCVCASNMTSWASPLSSQDHP